MRLERVIWIWILCWTWGWKE